MDQNRADHKMLHNNSIRTSSRCIFNTQLHIFVIKILLERRSVSHEAATNEQRIENPLVNWSAFDNLESSFVGCREKRFPRYATKFFLFKFKDFDCSCFELLWAPLQPSFIYFFNEIRRWIIADFLLDSRSPSHHRQPNGKFDLHCKPCSWYETFVRYVLMEFEPNCLCKFFPAQQTDHWTHHFSSENRQLVIQSGIRSAADWWRRRRS